MIFLCPKIEKCQQNKNRKKNVENKILKNENLRKNELAQAATTCYLTLGKNIKEKLYILNFFWKYKT